jgi:hypothetical protein
MLSPENNRKPSDRGECKPLRGMAAVYLSPRLDQSHGAGLNMGLTWRIPPNYVMEPKISGFGVVYHQRLRT